MCSGQAPGWVVDVVALVPEQPAGPRWCGDDSHADRYRHRPCLPSQQRTGGLF